MRRAVMSLAAVALLFSLAGCGRPAAETAAAFKPTATLQDIMVSVIDPAADRVWNSVSTEITRAGVVEKQPRTEEEWAALRIQAVTLLEAANLLAVEGRPVVGPRKSLDNKAGYLDAAEIHRVIESTRPAYLLRVEEFRQAGARALAAVDERKTVDIVDAGARVQQACEHCHLQYWYPNSGAPTLAEFNARQAAAGSSH